MSEPTVMPKSEMLRRSMRCFILGWWSLVPVLGVLPGILALLQFSAVARRSGSRWNAGHYRLIAGTWLAGIGILLTIVLGALVALAIIDSSVHASSHNWDVPNIE